MHRTSKLAHILAIMAVVSLFMMTMSWVGLVNPADMLNRQASQFAVTLSPVLESQPGDRHPITLPPLPPSKTPSAYAVAPVTTSASPVPSASTTGDKATFWHIVPQDDAFGFEAQCGHISAEVAKNASWMPAHVSLTRMGYNLSHHGINDHVSENAMELGCYDCDLVDAYRAVKAHHGDRQVVFFDIGSNVGSEFAQAAMNNDLVLAFEPLQPNVQRICENVWLNNWRNTVRIFPLGLADRDMPDSSMCFNIGNSGSSPIGSSCDPENTLTVKVASLPRLFKEQRIYELPGPWFVHVDVENFEYQLLHAGRDFFTDKRVAVLAVSLGMNTSTQPWGSREELIAWFLDQGYYVMVWGVKYATKESISSMPDADMFIMRDL